MTLDIATCMYCTGIEPFSKKPVTTAKNLNDRKLQRALMQFFKPENYFEVREALPVKGEKPGERGAEPPKTGYRPDRKSARRQEKNKKPKSGLRP